MNSDFLFVQPSFWRGFCRTADMFGTFDEYNQSLSPADADNLALASDVLAIGVDMRNSIQSAEEPLEVGKPGSIAATV